VLSAVGTELRSLASASRSWVGVASGEGSHRRPRSGGDQSKRRPIARQTTCESQPGAWKRSRTAPSHPPSTRTTTTGRPRTGSRRRVTCKPPVNSARDGPRSCSQEWARGFLKVLRTSEHGACAPHTFWGRPRSPWGGSAARLRPATTPDVGLPAALPLQLRWGGTRCGRP
jgi:hypothetical protein